MKLAIITAGFKPVPAVNGGAVEQLVTDMIYANEGVHRYDIDLYTVYDKRLSQYDLKYTHIIALHNPQKNLAKKTWHYFYRKLTNASNKRINYMSIKIANNFKRDYYDAVLVENNMDTYNYLYKLKTKEKFYFHLHNDFDNGDVEKNKTNTCNIIKTADKILVVSNYLKRKLQKYGAKRIELVPNFINDELFSTIPEIEQRNLRRQFNINLTDKVFTYVGRFDKGKGADKLLEALIYLKDIKNIKCIMVGDKFFNSKEEEKFNKRLKKALYRLKGKVIFTGYIDNTRLNKIYSISDCIVIPSQVEEAFGMVALEAMRMKKPVIAANSGALPEVLSSKGSIIIKRDNRFVKSLAEAIKILSCDRSKRLRMGQINYQTSQRFPHSKEEYFSLIINALK